MSVEHIRTLLTALDYPEADRFSLKTPLEFRRVVFSLEDKFVSPYPLKDAWMGFYLRRCAIRLAEVDAWCLYNTDQGSEEGGKARLVRQSRQLGQCFPKGPSRRAFQQLARHGCYDVHLSAMETLSSPVNCLAVPG